MSVHNCFIMLFKRRLIFIVAIAVLFFSPVCFAKENIFKKSKGYCTWYAAERFNAFSPVPGVNWRGHAGDWLENADSRGWLTTEDPYDAEIGSLIVWLDRNDKTNQSGKGHVAVVDSIDWGKKEIYISEMNWGPLMPGTDPKEAKTTKFDSVTTKTLSLGNLNRKGRVSTYHFQGYILPRPKNFSLKDILNAKYQRATLVDGVYKNGDPWRNPDFYYIWVNKNKDDDYFVAFDHLDEDDKRDAVVATYTNFGGSGSFLSINAFINNKGKPFLIDEVKLGQKSLMSLKIVNGIIRVILLKHGPNDPMCCPSILEEKEYKLIGKKIVSIY